MEYLACGEIEGAREIVFFLLSWRHDFLLAPSGHPRGTDFGQEMDSEFISKDEPLMRLQVLNLPPNPGQAFHPLRIVIFGNQRGSFPYPAQFMQPAPYRPSGDLKAMFGMEFAGQCGTTPAGATPPKGPWGCLEKSGERSLDPGHQDGSADGPSVGRPRRR